VKKGLFERITNYLSTALNLCLIQFSRVFLSVNSNLNGNAVIRQRCRSRSSSVAVQYLCLNPFRIIDIAFVEVNVTADTVNLAFAGVLPDAVSTAVICVLTPMCKPDGISTLDVVIRIHLCMYCTTPQSIAILEICLI